jgi:hypothetical protein
MNWIEVYRRIAAGEEVEHVLDEKSAADRASFRGYMLDLGRTDPRAVAALAEYDKAMRDLDTGVMGARATWAALSRVQRKILALAAANGGTLERNGKVYHVRWGVADLSMLSIRVSSIRALAARDLFAWDGGYLDPEAAVVLTERGRFVLAHGREGDSPSDCRV